MTISKTAVVLAAKQYYRKNASEIMMGGAITGTITTAYLAAKAGYAHRKHTENYPPFDAGATRVFKAKTIVKDTWRIYIPTAIATTGTITAIACGFRINTTKTAAVYSLLTASERAFDEYKTHVLEELGPKKERDIRDRVAQSGVDKNPPTIVIGSGAVLCKETYTGRYFESDMETLRKAVNTINSKLLRDVYVTLDDFYWEVNLPSTTMSSSVGWESDRLLELSYSAAIATDGKPCICIEYNYIKPL